MFELPLESNDKENKEIDYKHMCSLLKKELFILNNECDHWRDLVQDAEDKIRILVEGLRIIEGRGDLWCVAVASDALQKADL